MPSTSSRQFGRIALWGCFHAEDQADALVAAALLAELRRRQPQAHIIAFSPDPADTYARHALETRALRPGGAPKAVLGGSLFAGRCRARLADVDVMIVAGGDPSRGNGEALNQLCTLARRTGTRLDLLSPTVDSSAAQIPDPLFATELLPAPPAGSRSPVVGVNPGAESLPRLVNFVAWLLLERYDVRLVASSPEERRLCQELERRLRMEGVLGLKRSLLAEAATATDPLAVLRGCDLVVATRFHCILLAALLRIPVLGLCETSISRDLLESLGQGRHAIEIASLGTPRLVDEFCSLRASAARVRDILAARVPERRKALREHLDHLYGPVVTL